MSELLNFLATASSRSGNADSFRLQQMGRTAATQFAEQSIPLNHTIRGLAKEAGLNSEQIKRVAETANNEAFLHKFRQPFDQNISFPLADSNQIARDIHAAQLDTTAGQVKTAGKYSATRVTTRYIPGAEAYSIEKLFGGRSFEKTASTRALSQAELRNVYILIKDQNSVAKQAMEAGEERILAKFAQLSRIVEQEQKCGEPNWAIGAAVGAANPSKELYEIVQHVLGHSMEPCSLQKVAQMGQQVEPDNQITGLVQDLEAIMQKLTATEETVQRTGAQIQELLTLLQGQPEPNPANELFQEQVQQPQVQQMQAQQPGAVPTQQQPGTQPQAQPPQGM